MKYDTLEDDDAVPSARFSRAAAWPLLAGWALRVAKATADSLDELYLVTAAHWNWCVDQREFAAEAARDIETIQAR